MNKRLLIQTQLSNYDDLGVYILENDSGWNMCVNRALEMLKLDSTLKIDILVPKYDQVKTLPEELTQKYSDFDRVTFLQQQLTDHAIKTRFDFKYDDLEDLLQSHAREYTHTYLNDPCLMTNYKTLFYKSFNCEPKMITHNHFVDYPEERKVPKQVEYFWRHIEAAVRSDFNFWQCQSSMLGFFESLEKYVSSSVLNCIKSKSEEWNDGYSSAEINTPINAYELRFELPKDKIIIFVPNRVGRTNTYTNCDKFLFDYANKLYEERQDFVIVFGNPSQKIQNREICNLCKPALDLIPDTFSRNEYRYVIRNSHINIGLYNLDRFGGTAALECIDLGCLPIFLNNFEYKRLMDATDYRFRAKTDFSDIIEQTSKLIDYAKSDSYRDTDGIIRFKNDFGLRKLIYETCAFESTTKRAMQRMELL